jgi:hypothetical protein
MDYHKRSDSEKLNAMKARFDSILVYQEHVVSHTFVKKFVQGKSYIGFRM